MVTKKKLVIGLVLGVLLIGYYYLYKYTSFSIQCIFHWISGYYCPGCGITRMLFSLLKLDFYQAFRFNPLVFIIFFLAIIYFFINIMFNYKIKIPRVSYYILIGILIVYGILRNIPIFSFLEPTIIH